MIILHLVPKAEFEAVPTAQPFLAGHYSADGFIHCTAGWDVLGYVANSVYRDTPGDFIVLEIEAERLTAPVRFEPPVPPPPADHPLAGHLFPHIYGPINRDAIERITPVRRAVDGAFIL